MRSGVKHASAVELKHAPVKTVCSGLGNQVYDTAGVESVSGGQRTRLYAKFLQGVGEGKGKIDAGKCVIIVSTVEEIVCSIGLPAGHRDGDRAVEILTANFVAARRHHRRARNQNELCDIAAVQGELGDALRVHHVRDRSVLSLDQSGSRFHLHRFRHRADRKNRVERYVVVHLQHNSCLAVTLEPLFLDFKLIGPNWQSR